jgi:hypothetical protein
MRLDGDDEGERGNSLDVEIGRQRQRGRVLEARAQHEARGCLVHEPDRHEVTRFVDLPGPRARHVQHGPEHTCGEVGGGSPEATRGADKTGMLGRCIGHSHFSPRPRPPSRSAARTRHPPARATRSHDRARPHPPPRPRSDPRRTSSFQSTSGERSMSRDLHSSISPVRGGRARGAQPPLSAGQDRAPTEYAQIDQTLDPSLLDLLTRWLGETV